ncbi:hypothetical protein [Microbacterium gorillae]|uniref:hypothetical protein n=1 Tax=Microbacterium gorillae TaxID=1231063 RepID=UPI000590E63D|nr:hypothetical protein [Microbacterium gorillae]
MAASLSWRRPGIALVILAGLAMLPAAAPAEAVDRLLVSTDGVHFASSVVGSLFDDLGRVEPGDRATDTVWLRADTGMPITVQIQAADGWSDDRALATATTLSVTVDGMAGTPVSIAQLAENGCAVLTPTITLSPGETARVDATLVVSADLGRKSGKDGELGSMGFRTSAFAFDGDLDPGSGCDAGPSTPGPLPVTGGTVPLGWALAGGVAIVSGVTALLSRRRESRR